MHKKEDTGPLIGITFCLTGTLSRPRKEIELRIKAAGGKTTTSVSSKLDYLLAGESAGSKLEKANRLGVKVISESDLQEMIENKEGKDSFIEKNPENRQTSLGDY